MADKREAMGNLGDGEREGQIPPEIFLVLYPEGVFRPEPPSKQDVLVRVYPAGDTVIPYEND